MNEYVKPEVKTCKFPQFELVWNPTINLREYKEAAKTRTIRNVKITDTVSGKTTTVGKVYDELNDIFERAEVVPQKGSILGKMMNDLKDKLSEGADSNVK